MGTKGTTAAKISVYATGPWMEREVEPAGKWTAYSHDRHLAVIEGPEGVVVVCGEGVHNIHEDMDEEIYISLCAASTEGEAIMPSGRVKVTIADLVDSCGSEKAELGSFVRRFGERLETNYRLLLGSLKGIGLDPKEYPRGPDPRDS